MQNAQNEIMVFVIRQLQIPFHETAILTILIYTQNFWKKCFFLLRVEVLWVFKEWFWKCILNVHRYL